MPFLPMRMIRASGAANWPGSPASASRNWARRRTSASERDPEILRHSAVQGKTPLLAIGVEVEQCFFHCAKAFLRAHLWAHAAGPHGTVCRRSHACCSIRSSPQAPRWRTTNGTSPKATPRGCTDTESLGESCAGRRLHVCALLRTPDSSNRDHRNPRTPAGTRSEIAASAPLPSSHRSTGSSRSWNC